MNVPPFIPPQIEIPSNVAEAKYPVRIAFVKRVVGLHSAYWAVILGLALIPLPAASLGLAASVVFGSLLGLSLVRGLAKGWRHEQLLSALCVPPLTFGLVMLVQVTVAFGLPFWVWGLGPISTLMYAMLCGRDLSFVGMFVMTSLGSCGTILFGAQFDWFTKPMLWESLIGLLAFLLFFVYDLAALQTRRRLGEELGAVLDLFRDLLNFLTYPIRVISHWRRHRIWSRS
jgi:FtsH-binding integral membrane protein